MSYLPYDPTRRVPFASAPSVYARCEYHWWVANTGQPSELYTNGVLTPSETETGSFSLDLPTVWSRLKKHAATKIALIDVTTWHADIILDVLRVVDPLVQATLYPIGRYYDPLPIAKQIDAAAQAGNSIIVLPLGFGGPSDELKAAILRAGVAGTIIVCSLPNTPQDCDTIPDYPYSYGLHNVIGVGGVERKGEHYWSGYGTRAVAAPSRNIVGAGLYTSGNSYSAPMVAGLLGLYRNENPGYLAKEYVRIFRATSAPVGKANRINTSKLFPLPKQPITDAT